MSDIQFAIPSEYSAILLERVRFWEQFEQAEQSAAKRISGAEAKVGTYGDATTVANVALGLPLPDRIEAVLREAEQGIATCDQLHREIITWTNQIQAIKQRASTIWIWLVVGILVLGFIAWMLIAQMG